MSDYGNDPSVPPANAPQPYGAMPPPSEYEQRLSPTLPAGPPPQQVDRAVKMLLAFAAWGVIGALINMIFNRGATERAVQANEPTASAADVSSAVNFVFILSLVLALALGALYYICSRKMALGRSWARLTPSIVIAINVLFGLLNLGRGGAGIAGTLEIVSLALGMAFLWFSWSKPSNAFFAAGRRPR